MTLWRDLHYGLRTLLARPGFTVIAVLALALGIGANTALFSVVNAVVLRPLPYPQSERLMAVREINRRQPGEGTNVSYPNYLDWRNRSHSFQELAVYRWQQFVMRADDQRVPVSGVLMSANMFAALGLDPIRGRAFNAEDRIGGDPTVVVSYGFWVSKLGSPNDLSGITINLDEQSYNVVGVMPPNFEFPDKTVEMWAPIGPKTNERIMTNRAIHVCWAIGRLRAGVSLDEARQEMSAIARQVEQDNPGSDPEHEVGLRSLQEEIVAGVKPVLLILSGAVGLVLLIACANVGNLLLARSASREREIAIRAALGASRGRIVRQLLTESVLLSGLGGLAGLLIALWGVDLLVQSIPPFIPRLQSVGVDRTVLVYTLLSSLFAGIVFGLAPAIQASRPNLNDSLKESGTGGSVGMKRTRLRNVLVVSEVALSLVLLIGAGLMIKSLWLVQRVNPGFNPNHLVSVMMSLPPKGYQTSSQVVGFYEGLSERLLALPGVRASSAVSRLPITGSEGQGGLTIEGRPFAPGEAPGATYRRSLPNYFRTMGIPLLSGREFDERDNGVDRKVVVISRSMALRYWPDDDPLGKRIKVGPPENEPWLTIVGVVGDVKNEGLDVEPTIATYEPLAQRPRLTMNVVARTDGNPESLISAIRDTARAMEKDILIVGASTIEERMTTTLKPQRFITTLLSIFGALALALASIGIYGVVSFSVAQRTREIGIRMAMGARRPDILRLIVGHGLGLTLGGIVIGLGGALALTRLMSHLVFEVNVRDFWTFSLASIVLVAVALLASLVPARRATTVDPLVALRYE
jgi:predicted permease